MTRSLRDLWILVDSYNRLVYHTHDVADVVVMRVRCEEALAVGDCWRVLHYILDDQGSSSHRADA